MKSILHRVKRKIREYLQGKKRVKEIKGMVNSIETKTEQFGNKYGGYKIAVDLLNHDRELTVLSFGIGEDLSFSEDVIHRLNAQVYAFDPTPRSSTYVANHELANNERFHFFPYGISRETKTEKFYLPKVKEYVSCSTHHHDSVGEDYYEVEMHSFSQIIDDLKISEIDILKMDIEGSEFDVMDLILSSGISIHQIGIELHDHLFSDGSGHNKFVWIIKLLRDHSYHLVSISASGHEMTFVQATE